jgi:hypothetical protein
LKTVPAPVPTFYLNTVPVPARVLALVPGHIHFFFPIYFYGFLCIFTSAAPQRPVHGTVSSQVATHLRTDRVFRVCVLGRSWI